MRLNKLSELIHESAKRGRADFAEVEVGFWEIVDDGEEEQEEDSYRVVKGTAFKVSRRVDRKSKTSYRIDGIECTWREVSELL